MLVVYMRLVSDLHTNGAHKWHIYVGFCGVIAMIEQLEKSVQITVV